MANLKGLLDKYMNLGDERFFHDIFEKQEYAVTRNQKADIVLDVGALAGEFSAYIYDKAKTIYAIEPYSNHYEELINNIEEFKLKKIKPFKIALGGENSIGWLATKNRGGHVLSSKPEKFIGMGEEVEIKTLATFIREQRINHVDILKIDVEQTEEEIFNADDFKDVAYKIDFIIGEHIGGLERLFKEFGFLMNEYPENPYNVYFKRK